MFWNPINFLNAYYVQPSSVKDILHVIDLLIRLFHNIYTVFFIFRQIFCLFFL